MYSRRNMNQLVSQCLNVKCLPTFIWLRYTLAVRSRLTDAYFISMGTRSCSLSEYTNSFDLDQWWWVAFLPIARFFSIPSWSWSWWDSPNNSDDDAIHPERSKSFALVIWYSRIGQSETKSFLPNLIFSLIDLIASIDVSLLIVSVDFLLFNLFDSFDWPLISLIFCS